MITVDGIEYYVVSDFDLPIYTVHDRAGSLSLDNNKMKIGSTIKRVFTIDDKTRIDNYTPNQRGRKKRTEPRMCKVCGKSELEVKFPKCVLYCNNHFYAKRNSKKPIGKKAFLDKFNKEAWQERD